MSFPEVRRAVDAIRYEEGEESPWPVSDYLFVGINWATARIDYLVAISSSQEPSDTEQQDLPSR